MHRRRVLAAGAAGIATGLAGCGSLLETRPARSPPLVEDRPDAVYVPTHVEGMRMVDTAETGDYGVALTYSFPHRFWLITGDRPRKVEIGDNDSMHLMAVVWDRETRTVVPTSSVEVTAERDGETVIDEKGMWAMLSQNMGVHAGDNVELDGEGDYEVAVDIGPLGARTSGAFADRFDELVSTTFEMEFDRTVLEETSFERLQDEQGDRGAVEPMEMDMLPVSQAPDPDDLSWTVLGEGTSGDATFVVGRLDAPPAGIGGSDGGSGSNGSGYLAVSARTPYNEYPVVRASLSATVDRDGESVFDGPLEATFDDELGYHNGAVLDGFEDGDEVTVSVDAPPNVGRHEGYETAFLEFDDVTVTA